MAIKFSEFQRRLRALKELKKILPGIVGNQARNFFVDSWAKQGFTDNALDKWQEVKRRIEGTKAYKYPKGKKLGRRTRAINVETGRLRRSIRILHQGFARVVVGTTIEYAQYVNEARPFISRSKTLDREIRKTIDKTVLGILKPKK